MSGQPAIDERVKKDGCAAERYRGCIGGRRSGAQVRKPFSEAFEHGYPGTVPDIADRKKRSGPEKAPAMPFALRETRRQRARQRS
jgi:hypothetical protein